MKWYSAVNFAKNRSGFTLLELLIVLAISGILLGVANPPFTRLIQQHRADTLQSLLLSAIYNTRTTAVSTKSITSGACTPMVGCKAEGGFHAL